MSEDDRIENTVEGHSENASPDETVNTVHETAPPENGASRARRGGTERGDRLILGGMAILLLLVVIVYSVTIIVARSGDDDMPAPVRKTIIVPVGEVARTNDYSLKVNSWSYVSGDEVVELPEGMVYVCVNLTFSDFKTTPSTALMTAVDEDSYEYIVADWCTGPRFAEEAEGNDGKITGNVAFQVPVNIGSLTFRYQPMALEDVVSVPLKVAGG